MSANIGRALGTAAVALFAGVAAYLGHPWLSGIVGLGGIAVIWHGPDAIVPSATVAPSSAPKLRFRDVRPEPAEHYLGMMRRSERQMHRALDTLGVRRGPKEARLSVGQRVELLRMHAKDRERVINQLVREAQALRKVAGPAAGAVPAVIVPTWGERRIA